MQRLEQLVDQVGALDQVAHEHEQRDADQHVVAHHLEGRLHHQVERLADVAVVGDPGEDDPHAHQREGGGEAQHDRHHHQRQHQQAQMAAGDGLGAGQHVGGAEDDQPHDDEAEPQLLADLHVACLPALLLRAGGRRVVGHVLVGGEDILVAHVHHLLELFDVDFLDVFLAAGPLALLQALDAANDLDDPLQEKQRAGERNHEFERVDRQRVGREGLLADRRRFRREGPAGIGQRQDAGDEEDDVQDEVERRLRARAEKAVQHVAAHMAVLASV